MSTSPDSSRSRGTRSYERKSCSPAPAKSTGFDVDAVDGMTAASRDGELGRELWQLEPDARRDVRRDHGGAAAVGDDGDARPGRTAAGEQDVRHLDEILRRRHADDPGRPARGVDRARVADERARVRARGADARRARAACQQEDRLARLCRRVGGARERPAVSEVLAVDADDPRLGVSGEGAQQVGGLEVGLVADRRKARDAEPEIRREQGDLEREVAALRDQPDRPRGEVLGAEVELRAPVVDAHAVGAEQDGAGGTHALRHRALALAALVARLAEARRDRDDRARAGGERGVDRLLEGRRRHGEDDELRRLRAARRRSDTPGVP